MKSLAYIFAFWISMPGWANAQSANEKNTFNGYVLKAVTTLAKTYPSLGYGPKAFTHDLMFGDAGTLPATGAPITMCVAAQLEIFVEALNIYAQETGDNSPFHFIPKISWQRLRPLDFRGQIWSVDNSPSHGMADAYESFGMGKRISFRDLAPGSFLNFNRTNGKGHGVVFLGFLDKDGNDLSSFSDKVSGFKYFSAQGKGKPDAGLGYRWAFFSDAVCPALSGGRMRDCGVIRSENSNLLVSGFAYTPKQWDQKKAADQIFHANQTADDSLLKEGTFNSDFFDGVTTDD
jgi:hypothetical protein